MKAFEPTISVEIKAIWFELSIELLLLRSKCICRYVSSNFENNSFIADNLTCLKKTVEKLFERSVSIIINITLLLWSTIKLSERSRRQSFDSYIDISTCVVRFETNKKLSRSKCFKIIILTFWTSRKGQFGWLACRELAKPPLQIFCIKNCETLVRFFIYIWHIVLNWIKTFILAYHQIKKRKNTFLYKFSIRQYCYGDSMAAVPNRFEITHPKT